MYGIEDYKKSADFIMHETGGIKPEILTVLGSGLGGLAKKIEQPIIIPYDKIPNFKKSTAPGHSGNLIIGKINSKYIAAMQGRLHLYEGYTAEEAVYPIRTARLLGADKMIVTNACGGINTDFKIGDLMLISDHIKLFDPTPLRGPNIPEFGPRFADMSDVYTAEYRKIAKAEAEKLGIELQEGVYFYFPGPQYETPAEIRAARVLGADAAGMSTVPEAIAARHCGMKILGMSLITNMAAGISKVELSEQDVIDTANAASEKMERIICKIIERI